MGIWFISDEERLTKEREAFSLLESSSEWLKGISWGIDSPMLTVQCSIVTEENTNHLITLYYPPLFPDLPPFVKEEDGDEWWTNHQYRDGTLCLEWGPDNWEPQVTGAMMIESAYRLIRTEKPRKVAEDNLTVESRHELTLGQEVRSESLRFVFPTSLDNFFRSEMSFKTGALKFSQANNKECFTSIPTEITSGKGVSWFDRNMPQGVIKARSGYTNYEGIIFRTEDKDCEIPRFKIRSELETYMSTIKGLPEINDTKAWGVTKELNAIVIISSDLIPRFHIVFSGSKSIYQFSNILDNSSEIGRNPVDENELASKRIAIIGLGSLGSKVAISLCRGGVNDFVLIDDDLFLSGNVVRNDLTWQNVGQHKVDAVAEKIEMLSPGSNCDRHKVKLTGQENAAYINTVISKIGECDLVIDATADPASFNLLAGVAKREEIPLIWGEVFAGGIGGLIARSRPSKDPEPQEVRKSINQYSNDNPFEDAYSTDNYGLQDAAGETVIASDSDVSTIAGYLTSFAIDTTLNPEPSLYPYSIYFVGLKRGWIFEEPFATQPVCLDGIERKEEVNANAELSNDHCEFLKDVLLKAGNG